MKILSMTSVENLTEFVIDMETKKHVYGNSFTFRLEKAENGSFMASITQENRNPYKDDDVGALSYVIVVILIYGCSILMMIASYIRKNNVDRRLNRYIKDMALVRKRERQLQLLGAAARAASIIPEIPDERGGRGSLSGHSYVARRVSQIPMPPVEETEDEEIESPPRSHRFPRFPLSPRFKKKNHSPKPSPGPSPGLSSMLKDALLSGVAVGMWEGTHRKDSGITITCDFVDSERDNDTDTRSNKYSMQSPGPSEFDTTPDLGPSTADSASCASSIASSSSSEFFYPVDNYRKTSAPFLLPPQRPEIHVKRHSMPNEIDHTKENDLSFLNTKILPLAPPRKKSAGSFNDIQVVSTV